MYSKEHCRTSKDGWKRADKIHIGVKADKLRFVEVKKMRKYVKPFFFVIYNNSFLIMFLYILSNFEYWGVIPALVFGLGWLFSFIMLVVCVRYAKPPSTVVHFTGLEAILVERDNGSIMGDVVYNNNVEGKYGKVLEEKE